VADLLRIGAIERVQNVTTPGFYSRFFVVPKKQPGEWRAILDLKALNQFILIPKFKMETAHSIRRDLFHAQWTTSIDLIDAYMHVPIHPRYRHFLRFVVDDTVYQYRALPAGLCTAPWAFTRLIVEVKKFLHQLGIALHQYIDDWLIRALTYLLCQYHTQFTVMFIGFLGFFHHVQKSQLLPLQDFIFLGCRFLLHLSLVMPTLERFQKILTLVQWFLNQQQCPARQWQRLLGLLAATERMVPQGLLHMRPFQLHLHQAWDQSVQSQDALVSIPSLLRHELQWWSRVENVLAGVPIRDPDPQFQLFNDASLHGWGAHMGQLTTAGVWSEVESLLHINWLELKAVLHNSPSFISKNIWLTRWFWSPQTTPRWSPTSTVKGGQSPHLFAI
jgi:hypothetical protein